MKKTMLIFAPFLLTACATKEDALTYDTEQAVRDFIEVRQLEKTDKVRTQNDDQWQDIDQNFVLYLKRRDAYLFEFTRRCHELAEYPVVPDRRDSSNTIRAKFDTLRGCRIANIYPLTEDEVAELRDIGESPGSRN
ncbi:MAG: DUF6491 family protein [Thermodesulfobacteriota bacterium]